MKSIKFFIVIAIFLNWAFSYSQENYQLVSSFGNYGVVNLNSNYNHSYQILGSFISNDGEILILTLGQNLLQETYVSYYQLARLTTNGSIDTGFGVNAYETIDSLAGYINLFHAAGGKFLVRSSNDVIRYNEDGTLALSFGNSSLILVDNNAKIKVQNDGKRIASYTCFWNSGNYLIKFQRYTSDGVLDTSFNPTDITYGTSGVSFYCCQDFNGDKGIYTDNSDKVLYFAGTENNTFQSFRQLLFVGNLDDRFNRNGIQTLPITNRIWFSKKVDNSVFIYSDDYYNSTQIIKYNLAGSLAINEFQNKELKSISIFSIDRKLMFSKKNIKEVALSSLSKGPYIINAIDENDVSFSEKLIKL